MASALTEACLVYWVPGSTVTAVGSGWEVFDTETVCPFTEATAPLTALSAIASGHMPFGAASLIVMVVAGPGAPSAAGAARRTLTQLPGLTSTNCPGVSWRTFVFGSIATRLGSSFAAIITVLPASPSTLPWARTLSGAGAAVDSADAVGDSAAGSVDFGVVDELQPTSKTAAAESNPSKTGRWFAPKVVVQKVTPPIMPTTHCHAKRDPKNCYSQTQLEGGSTAALQCQPSVHAAEPTCSSYLDGLVVAPCRNTSKR